MKNENQSIWTTALRSGMYQQGDGRLVDVTNEDTNREVVRYCCLGVACDQYGLRRESDAFVVSGNHGDEHYDMTLPVVVSRWLGVNHEDPLIDMGDWKGKDGYPYDIRCATANDDLHLTFDEIADLVDYFGLTD